MPSSVRDLFAAAGLTPAAVVRWGGPVGLDRPGVYAVALTADPDDRTGLASCPLSADRVRELLDTRPELRVDGSRPSTGELAARLAALWLPDEPVLYAGLAGTSLHARVRAYYRTRLGARSPHAGGWPLKTLSVLGDLHVHVAPCPDPDGSERRMLSAFVEATSAAARAALHDPDLPLPFANLEIPKGPRKRHGITGAREPRRA